jgi:hypothetical protein
MLKTSLVPLFSHREQLFILYCSSSPFCRKTPENKVYEMAVECVGGGSGLCRIEKGRASVDITVKKVSLLSFIIHVSLLHRTSPLL